MPMERPYETKSESMCRPSARSAVDPERDAATNSAHAYAPETQSAP
jgi:hypothetical protein